MQPELNGTRTLPLLRALLGRPGPVPGVVLARELGVSVRTLRAEVKRARAWLGGRGLTIAARPRRGMWLEGDRAVARRLVAEAAWPGTRPWLRPEERVEALALYLLHPGGRAPMARLAAVLGVSRSTVKSDLGALGRLLQELGLALEARPGVGLEVRGTEAAVRCALVRLAFRCGEPPALTELGRAVAFPGPESAAAWGAVTRLVRAWEGDGSGPSAGELAAHLMVATERVRAGRTLGLPAEQWSPLTRTPQGQELAALAARLRTATGVALGPPDLALVTHSRPGPGGDLAAAEPDAALPPGHSARFLRLLLAEAGACLGLPLAEDPELRAGLEAHLGPALLRRRLGMTVKNPLAGAMQHRYPAVYAAAAAGCRLAGDELGLDLGPDEVAYVAMHLGAAVERHGLHRQRRVLVVCTTGLGSARLLAAQLVRHFANVVVADAIALHELGQANLEGVELVVATVPLALDRPVVEVSPLLDPVHLAALEAAGLIPRAVPSPGGDEQLVAAVLDLVEQHLPDWDRERVRAGLRVLLAPGAGPPARTTPAVDVPAAIARLEEAWPTGHQLTPEARERFAVHLELAAARLRQGVRLAAAARAVPSAVLAAVRVALAGYGFSNAELEFLAGVLAGGGVGLDGLPVEAAARVAGELGLDGRERLALVRGLRAALGAARAHGIEFGLPAAVTLAAHLAAVGLRGARLKEVPLPPEVRSQLEPRLLEVGAAMARRAAAAMGTRPRSWEGELLAVHAGSARLQTRRRAPSQTTEEVEHDQA